MESRKAINEQIIDEQNLKHFEPENNENDIEEDIDNIPFSPEEIRIVPKMFSSFQIFRLIQLGDLELQPEFQRNIVWNDKKKSLLIESLMLNIPIPAFYFGERKDGKKIVIDGLQRLYTIYSFMDNNFKLKGLEYLTAFNGKKFEDLPRKYSVRIEETQLIVNVLDARCPDMVKFDVFRRVNTGGMPLNPQEIRNAMATTETRNLLLKMMKSDSFINACRGAVSDKRMAARELCLRFIAFYCRYDRKTGEVASLKSMLKMLDETILFLNEASGDEKQHFYNIFENAMEKSHALLGSTAFTKTDTLNLINKPLFIAWSVVLADLTQSVQELTKLQEKAIQLQSEYLKQKKYYDVVTFSTAARKSVQLQFEMVAKIMEELFEC